MRRTPTLTLAVALLALLIGGLAVGPGSRVTAQESMPDAAATEATVQRFYDVFNTGRFDALDEVLADHWASYAPNAGPGTSRENFEATVLLFREAFPDLHVETEEMLVDGDRVAVRSTMTGTQEGTFLGVAPTGTSVTTQFIDIHHLEGGVIAESYHVEDLLGIFFQVGAFPPVPAAAATPAP